MKFKFALVIIFGCFFIATAQSQVTGIDSNFVYIQLKNPNSINKWILKKGVKHSQGHPLKNLIDSFQIKEINQPFKYTKHAKLSNVLKIPISIQHSRRILNNLKNNSAIKHVEFGVSYEPIMQHSDTNKTILWHDFDLNLAKAHTITKGDSNVTIAVIDYVFSRSNKDLISKWWINKNEIPNDNIDNDSNGYIDDINGWNFARSSNNPFYFLSGLPEVKIDRYKHGTAVSTLIAGEVENGNSTIGACPGCRIMALNIQLVDSMDYHPKWDNHSVDPYDAFIYAAFNGAKIINCSFGRIDKRITTMEELVFHYCDSLGCILVGGVGNNFNYKAIIDDSLHFFPSNDPRFISVGSISRDRYYSKFSNAGKYTKVDFVAPGDNIICGGIKSNDYFIEASGTSLSTPLISGILGLIISRYPSLNKSQIIDVLRNGSNDIEYKNFEFNNQLGYGLPNAYACVQNTKLQRADFYTKTLEQIGYKDSNTKFYCNVFPNGKYIWDWGDGTSNITRNTTITKKYSVGGLYTISLISIDSISNYRDTVVRANYFFVQSYKTEKLSYNRNWLIGDNYNLTFNKHNKITNKNNFFSNRYSNGILTPLNQYSKYYASNIFEITDNGFIIEQNIGIQSSLGLTNYSDTLSKDLLKFNCSPIYLESTGNSLLKSGYLIPDIVSDSMIFVQYISLYDHQSYNTLKTYKFAHDGKSKLYPIKINIDTSLGYAYQNSMIYDDLIIFPNYDSNYYWVIARPTDIANFANGDYLLLYKLTNVNNVLKYQFVRKLNTDLGDSINTYNYSSMIISPNGKKLIVQYDTFLSIYNFDNRNGFINKIHRSISQMTGVLGTYTQNISFSADSKLVYGVQQSTASQIFELYQLNLDTNVFRLSPKIIERSISNRYTALSLGPDSLIYINNSFDNKLSVISKPDSKISKNYTNECGYLNYGLDFNTEIPLTYRDTTKNSQMGLPLYIHQNIPDSIVFAFKFRTCDSIQLCSNFPSRIFHRWIVNSDTLNSLNPVFQIHDYKNNTIKLIVDSLVVQQIVDFTDSIKGLKIKFNPEKYLNIYHDSNAFGKVRLTLNPNPLFSPYDSIFWSNQEGGYSIGLYSDTFEFSKPFHYFGVAKNYCFPISFGPISIKFPCSDTKYNMAYYNNRLSQHTIPHLDTGVILMSNINYINPGSILRLHKCVVLLEDGASIEIMPGGKLVADSVYFVSCGTWNGIKVNGNPMLNLGRDTSGSIHGAAVLTHCQILDAKIGIESVNGGFLYLSKNIFSGNNLHLNLLDYPHPHNSNVSNNIFGLTTGLDSIYNALNQFKLSNAQVNYQVKCSNIKFQSLNNNKFTNIRLNKEQVQFQNVGAVLDNCDHIEFLNNEFQAIDNTINILDTNGTNNRYVHNDFYAKSSLNSYLDFTSVKTTGIRLINPLNVYLSLNLFDGGYSGIEYYQVNSNNSPSLIEKNKFQRISYGLITAKYLNPLFSNTLNNYSPIQCKLQCNTFLSCDYGWIGTGKYVLFDSVSHFNISPPRGNYFLNSKYQNTVVKDSNFENYYGNILEKFDTINTFNINLDGKTINLFNMNSVCAKSYNISSFSPVSRILYLNAPNCNGKRKSLYYNEIAEQSLNVFPNPTKGFIFINNQINFNYEIFNVGGVKLLEGIYRLNEGIDITSLSEGIYYIKLKQKDSTYVSRKIIKIN